MRECVHVHVYVRDGTLCVCVCMDVRGKGEKKKRKGEKKKKTTRRREGRNRFGSRASMSWKEFLSTDPPFSESAIVSPLQEAVMSMDGSGKAGLGCEPSGIFFPLRGTCRETKETHRFIPGADSRHQSAQGEAV